MFRQQFDAGWSYSRNVLCSVVHSVPCQNWAAIIKTKQVTLFHSPLNNILIGLYLYTEVFFRYPEKYPWDYNELCSDFSIIYRVVWIAIISRHPLQKRLKHNCQPFPLHNLSSERMRMVTNRSLYRCFFLAIAPRINDSCIWVNDWCLSNNTMCFRYVSLGNLFYMIM